MGALRHNSGCSLVCNWCYLFAVAQKVFTKMALKPAFALENVLVKVDSLFVCSGLCKCCTFAAHLDSTMCAMCLSSETTKSLTNDIPFRIPGFLSSINNSCFSLFNFFNFVFCKTGGFCERRADRQSRPIPHSRSQSAPLLRRSHQSARPHSVSHCLQRSFKRCTTGFEILL